MDKPSLELVSLREGHGVNDDVDATPMFLQSCKGADDIVVSSHVTGEHEAHAKRLAERAHAPLDSLPDIGQCQLCPFAMQRLCDRPCDTVIVGDAKHDCSFVRQQRHLASTAVVAV